VIKFKLSKTSFILLNVFIFLIIIVRSIYLYDVVKNREVFFELILAFLSTFLSLFPFTFSWYKFGRPRLTDWVKFSTFLYLILNYYLVSDKFDLKDVGIYGEVYVNISYIYDTLLVIFVGLLTINIVDFVFLIINFKNIKETASSKLKGNYVLRNEQLFLWCCLTFYF
jgi:ABC-type phosphate/phosphonate transport system permease subunit